MSTGKAAPTVSGDLKTSQKFALNLADLKEPAVTSGDLEESTWTLPPGEFRSATLSFRLPPAPESVWRPELRSPVLTSQTVPGIPAPELKLPAATRLCKTPPTE